VLVIGQSLELHTAPLEAALVLRDPGPLAGAARSQLAAGAGALDINLGLEAEALDLHWAASALRAAVGPGVTLFLDAGSPAALAAALELCERDGVPGPLVANALPAGALGSSDGDALLRACARSRAGLVLSPHGDEQSRPLAAEEVAETARHMLLAARAAGVYGPLYLDALAYPAALDAARCRRSLDVLRLLASLAHALPLAAAGNVGHGAPLELRPALRLAYAAAAAGAGAAALILPVEQAGLLDALRAALGEREPTGDEQRWAREVALAVGEGAAPPRAPASNPALAAASRLLFGEA
jgi:hypothetical protein